MSQVMGDPVSRITGFNQNQHGVTQLIFSIPVLLNTSLDGLHYPIPASIPVIPGFGFVAARAKQSNDGTWNWELTYEGSNTLSNPNDPTGGDLAVYALEPSDEQIPLQSNPNWDSWVTQGFVKVDPDGKLIIPATYQVQANNSSPSNTKKNPFLGQEDYLSIGAIWSKTYVVKGNFPEDIFNGVETIVTSVPTPSFFTLPVLGAGRNWLKKMPQISVRGLAITISERYLLSGRGGHNPYVYKGIDQ